MLSVKQGSTKYNFFLSLWYDSTQDWTPVSPTICENSRLETNKTGEKEKKENDKKSKMEGKKRKENKKEW